MARGKKLTRSAYKRKMILFGLALFLSIGLISTGFATWMMSSSAKSESNGNVAIGVIQSANVSFEEIKVYRNNEYYDAENDQYGTEVVLVTDLEHNLEGGFFSFEPHLSDLTGRVHAGESEYGSESLSLTIKGVVGPIDVLKDVTISMELSASVQKAVEVGYIEIPSVAEKNVVLTYGHGLEFAEGSTTNLEFEYTIEFKWGSAFNHLNPGIYFDEDASGQLVSIDDIRKDLLYLRAYVYGYDKELDALYTALSAGTINTEQFAQQADALQKNPLFVAPIYKITIVGNVR